MRYKGVILVAGLAAIVLSATFLLVTAGGEVRYSADHGDTVPFWHRWVPALVGIALIRLLPAPPAPPAPVQIPTRVTWTPRAWPARSASPVRPDRARWAEALVLLGAAALFGVSLRLAGGGEPAHTLLKLALLLGVPLLLFKVLRTAAGQPGRLSWMPVVPVAAWLVLGYATPLAVPPTNGGVDGWWLVAALVVGFAVNSLLEEFFYRRWLQTRWEALLGEWPAIVLAALLWSVWHVGIQGSGSLSADLASAVAAHGVDGLFLGYLWSRYRLVWPVLTVHGAMNAGSLVLALW